MMTAVTKLAASALLIVLVGCAAILPDVDPPKVSIESIDSLPSQNAGPRFLIKLRVTNPNKQDLDVAGISYTIDLLGKEVVSGVTNEVPLIEGFTEEIVTLEAGINLFQVLQLVASMGKNQSDTLDYRFAAKIDFNGFIPTQYVEETGALKL